MDAVDWLLEEDAPGVARLTRLRLLGESPASRRLRTLARRADEYAPVAAMLARAGEALEAGDYRKYTGAFWTLIFLAEMQASPDSQAVRALVERAFERQLPSGGVPVTANPSTEVVCLTANILRSLVHFGHGDDPRVVAGYRRLAERIVPNGGVPCFIVDYHSMRTRCRMTIPQTLRALAAAPEGVPADVLDPWRDLLVSQLLEMRVYRYVRPDAKRFYEISRLPPKGERPPGTTFAEFKAAYLAEHPRGPEEWRPKQGWTRFGFPHSYNPDLLQGMLALAELGVDHDPVLDEALDLIESKRGKDGRWRMESSLNGKMLADVEAKAEPSKWITLHALTVLRHFGRA